MKLGPLVSLNYRRAFERNLGCLISSEIEQRAISNSLVAIAGCGGVGGRHAETMARLGIGKFRIVDPDTFSISNVNRQIGALHENFGKNKAEVTAAMIRSINPEAKVQIFKEKISFGNAEEFLHGAHFFLDGIDFFEIEVRRKLFQIAREKNIPALTAAPLGMSAALLVFGREGMSFDEYFDLSNQLSKFEQIVRFYAGLAPKFLQRPYMDLKTIRAESGRAPSSVIGCELASAMIGAAALGILLGGEKDQSKLAPNFMQFDAYRQKAANGRLRFGNKGLLQKLKIRLIRNTMRKMGYEEALNSAGLRLKIA